MTLWARLTWQSDAPGALAADLGRLLGLEPVRRGLRPGPGTWRLPLVTAELELRPWRAETPDDAPEIGGRLVLEPVPGGDQPPEDTGPADLAGPGGGRLVLAGIGWATVELDRAERELREWLLDEPPAPGRAGSDPHLGARTRIRWTDTLPGDAIVLAEPSTEGRLAASLARNGEGPCALYLWPEAGFDAWIAAARGRGVTVGGRRLGPLGAAVVVPVPGVGVAGPHLIVVTDRRPSSPSRRASTIGA